VPGQVLALDPAAAEARIDVAGAQRDVCTLLLGDEVAVGDWVLIHVGFAMARLDEEEARRSLALLSEAIASEQNATAPPPSSAP
jgi:hydrogenase expression/formation protein HypC